MYDAEYFLGAENRQCGNLPIARTIGRRRDRTSHLTLTQNYFDAQAVSLEESKYALD